MNKAREQLLVLFVALCPALATAQLGLDIPEGISIQVSNGQFRLNAEYWDLVTFGAHSFEYRLNGSAPLGDSAALATNKSSGFTGGGYRLNADIGYMWGNRGSSPPSTRGFSKLGIATEPTADSVTRHFISARLRGGADYDRHDVVSKEQAAWATRTPEAVGDYRLQAVGVFTWRAECPSFISVFTAFGGVSWSHEFDVSAEEICAPVASGSETTSCRSVPTTERLPPRGPEFVPDFGGSLTLLFYGPQAAKSGVRMNPGVDVGIRFTLDDPAHLTEDGQPGDTALLNIGAFITPDFGWTDSPVHLRSGIWMDIPLKGFDDDTLSFTVLLGATY